MHTGTHPERLVCNESPVLVFSHKLDKSVKYIRLQLDIGIWQDGVQEHENGADMLHILYTWMENIH